MSAIGLLKSVTVLCPKSTHRMGQRSLFVFLGAEVAVRMCCYGV